jgi:carbon starvation protein
LTLLRAKEGRGKQQAAKEATAMATTDEAAQRSPVHWSVWVLICMAGAAAFAIVALNRGETVNAVWLVIAAVCSYLIAYRFYSLFIADRVLGVDPARATPAIRRNDALDYVPTNRYVLFGHHFAAIAGAGPLVGPVLAAQMGYLPGTLWIIAGVVFAGAVQDFVILFLSTRRDGRSLGDMIKSEMGTVPGVIALFGVLAIMVILLAVLALIVVKALADSPWGTFTVFATIPIAMLMGIYGRFLRAHRIGEMSGIGFVLLIAAIMLGQGVSQSPTLSPMFTFSGESLALMLIAYGFIASVLPVWLLLAPRDYLSTFLKIGTIVGLAIGILIVMPELKMPAVSRFVDGTGPVFAGSLFPFLFITIACGAVSGFHALIASGTTPKMIENEGQIRFIGYGAMLMESFVAIMALIAASIIEPGAYFAMNSPPAVIGSTAADVAARISSWGFVITPDALTQLAHDVGEKTVLSRTGGAPTLAVGMAHILSNVIGGNALMAFWYHFAILFEALFILTTVDAGTRVARFMIQDLLGTFVPAMRETQSWGANLVATTLAVGAWGYFLYQGVVDPLGGINTLWPLFGISNQMLAAIALILATVILFKMKRQRYAWVTIVPTVWLVVCTLTAGWQKLFHEAPAIGFIAQANRFSEALAEGKILAPAKSIADMHRVVFANYLDAALCAVFMAIVVAMIVSGVMAVRRALATPTVSTHEVGYDTQDLGTARA